MKTTQYLYGLDPSMLKDMPYEEALKLKLESATELIRFLTDKDFHKHYERIVDIMAAITHTQYLLDELEGRE